MKLARNFVWGNCPDFTILALELEGFICTEPIPSRSESAQ